MSPIRRLPVPLAVLLASAVALGGCSMVTKAVANQLSSGAGGDAFTSDNDPDLVGDALPFALKTYESLLASLPKHEPLLVATCAGFTQYGYGWVQAEAEGLQFEEFTKSQQLNARAYQLFARARGYCWRALEIRFPGGTARLATDPAGALKRAQKKDVPLLYWSAASLGAAISAGGVGKPEVVIDLPVVRALAERALALDDGWSPQSPGSLHELMIAIDSQEEALGGSEARARQHFDRAVQLQQGRSPGPYVSLALGVAKAKQQRAEFQRLMEQALAIDPDQDPSNRLAAVLTQRRARLFLDHIDDLFIGQAPASAWVITALPPVYGGK